MQGGEDSVVGALARGSVDDAPLDEKHGALFKLVEKITRHAYRVVDEDVDGLRALGWTDPEIAEAVYITALFAFFNRVADAFGLEDPAYRQMLEK